MLSIYNKPTWRKSLLFVICLTLCLSCQTNRETDLSSFLADMDHKVPGWLDEFIVPGAALAIIENGEVVLQRGYGFANVEENIRVDENTGFNIGSISKTVAAWGVMKLVQEEKIGLDDPAEKYLTRWHLPASEFDVNQVTIRRLLSHTAGLSLHGYPGWSANDTLPSVEESLNGKNNGPGDVRIIMEPGTQWKYSGGGFTICQLIVEEVTGQLFADYMQTEVLNPLGMKSSSYNIDESILKSSSKEHNNYGEEIPFELFTAQAAAGLHTTIADFSKFALASLDLDQTVLTTETIAEMIKPADASEGTYGLGYGIDQLNESQFTLVGHGGANTGWHAYLRLDPKTKDGFIMFTNGGSGYNVYRQAYCDWVAWKYDISLGNRCKKTLEPTLIRTMKSEGIAATIEKYKALKNEEPDNYFFGENLLNSFGYSLLQSDEKEAALEIFKLNVEEYPDAWNVYDSLGEAYMELGDDQNAIINYQKSVELNPDNVNGKAILKRLKEKVANLPAVQA